MKKVVLLATLFLSLNNYSQCWKEISASYQHTLAIKQNGTLWAWGKNTDSQLGIRASQLMLFFVYKVL